jgi:hypothetical protein
MGRQGTLILFIVDLSEHQGSLTLYPEQESSRIKDKGNPFNQMRRNILYLSFNLTGFIEMKMDFNAVDPVFTPHFFWKDDPVTLNHFPLRFFILNKPIPQPDLF